MIPYVLPRKLARLQIEDGPETLQRSSCTHLKNWKGTEAEHCLGNQRCRVPVSVLSVWSWSWASCSAPAGLKQGHCLRAKVAWRSEGSSPRVIP